METQKNIEQKIKALHLKAKSLEIQLDRNLVNNTTLLDMLQNIFKAKIITSEEVIQKVKLVPPKSANAYLAGQEVCLTDNGKKIINFDQSEIMEQCNNNGLQKEYINISSEKIMENASTMYSYITKNVQGDLKGYCGAYLLKSGFNLLDALQRQSSEASKKHVKFSVIGNLAIFIGTTFYLSHQNLKISQNVKEEYFSMVKMIVQGLKNEKDKNLIQKAMGIRQKFYNIYGKYIDVGRYVCGATYKNIDEILYSKEISQQQNCQVGSFLSGLSVKGAGIFGLMIGNGQIDVNFNKEQINKAQNKKYDVSGSVTKRFQAYPMISDLQDWSKVVYFNNNYWKVLAKKTNFIPIFEVIKNKINRQNNQNVTPQDLQMFQQFEKTLNPHKIEKGFLNSIIYGSQQKPKLIYLMGVTGSGKSTLGNQLLGKSKKYPFKTSNSINSETKQVSSQTEYCNLLGSFTIYDCPGFRDNTINKNNINTTIIENLHWNKSNNILAHAIILVVKVKDRSHVASQFEELMSILGPNVAKSVIIVCNYQTIIDKNKNYGDIENNYAVRLLSYHYSFNKDKQLAWNYLTSSQNSQREKLNQYNFGCKAKLFYKIRNLKPFTVDDYLTGKTESLTIKNRRNMNYYEDKKLLVNVKQILMDMILKQNAFSSFYIRVGGLTMKPSNLYIKQSSIIQLKKFSSNLLFKLGISIYHFFNIVRNMIQVDSNKVELTWSKLIQVKIEEDEAWIDCNMKELHNDQAQRWKDIRFVFLDGHKSIQLLLLENIPARINILMGGKKVKQYVFCEQNSEQFLAYKISQEKIMKEKESDEQRRINLQTAKYHMINKFIQDSKSSTISVLSKENFGVQELFHRHTNLKCIHQNDQMFISRS